MRQFSAVALALVLAGCAGSSLGSTPAGKLGLGVQGDQGVTGDTDADADADSDTDADTDTDTGTADTGETDTSVGTPTVTIIQDVADVLVHVDRAADGPVDVEIQTNEGPLTLTGSVANGVFEARVHLGCAEVASGKVDWTASVDGGTAESVSLVLDGSYVEYTVELDPNDPTHNTWDYTEVPAAFGLAVECSKDAAWRQSWIDLATTTTLTFWAQDAGASLVVTDRRGGLSGPRYVDVENAPTAGILATVTLAAGSYDVLIGPDESIQGDGTGEWLWGVWPTP